MSYKKFYDFPQEHYDQAKMRMYADSWGEGCPIDYTSKDKYLRYRTNFSKTMEPYRGPRTYPVVKIFRGQ